LLQTSPLASVVCWDILRGACVKDMKSVTVNHWLSKAQRLITVFMWICRLPGRGCPQNLAETCSSKYTNI